MGGRWVGRPHQQQDGRQQCQTTVRHKKRADVHSIRIDVPTLHKSSGCAWVHGTSTSKKKKQP